MSMPPPTYAAFQKCLEISSTPMNPADYVKALLSPRRTLLSARVKSFSQPRPPLPYWIPLLPRPSSRSNISASNPTPQPRVRPTKLVHVIPKRPFLTVFNFISTPCGANASSCGANASRVRTSLEHPTIGRPLPRHAQRSRLWSRVSRASLFAPGPLSRHRGCRHAIYSAISLAAYIRPSYTSRPHLGQLASRQFASLWRRLGYTLLNDGTT